MTQNAEISDRLRRLAKRREDDGIYTDANLADAAAARLEALEAENARLREALQSVETQADNAAWNIGRPEHNFTPADIQAGYFNIRDFARRAREGGNADG